MNLYSIYIDEVQAGCHEKPMKMSCQDSVKCMEWCGLAGALRGYCSAGSCVCVECIIKQSYGQHSTEVPPTDSTKN